MVSFLALNNASYYHLGGKPSATRRGRCRFVALSGDFRGNRNPSALGGQADMPAGENFFQFAAPKFGAPQRSRCVGVLPFQLSPRAVNQTKRASSVYEYTPYGVSPLSPP